MRLFSLFAIVLGALLGAPAFGTSCGDPDERLNALIVRAADGVTATDVVDAIESANPELGAEAVDQVPGRPIHLLELSLPPAWGIAELDQFEASLLTDYAGVLLWGEFLYADEVPEGSTGNTFVDGFVDDAVFNSQYLVMLIGLETAHAGSQGAGTVVAVLDTGVDAGHPQFQGSIVAGGYDFVDDDADTADVGDGQDNDDDGLTDEMVGHGTYVAGLVRLTAPGAQILPVRVIDGDGNGDLWQLARGMFHAIDQGVEVINVSITSTYKSEAVEAAVDEANALGIVVVAAAGNCNTDEPEEHPAQQSGVVGVVATDDDDLKAGFSNYGVDLVIAAPGASVVPGGVPEPARSIFSVVPGGGYAVWEGTSLATPIVSGTVALLRAQHPQWPADETTHDTIVDLLASSAVDIDWLNPGFAGLLGAGRLDAAAAVDAGPPAPELGDLDGNGVVDVIDLLALLGDWGLVHSSADLDGSGAVTTIDLIILLAAWS